MKFFKLIRSLLIKVLEYTLIVVVAVLVFAVCWQVFSRYVLSRPAGWTEELATLLLVWASMLGASAAYVRKSHLGVDYFVSKLDRKTGLIVECVVHTLVAFFAGYVMIGGGWKLVAAALSFHQLTPALGLARGHAYMVIPISGAFILLFAVEMFCETVSKLRKGEAPEQ